LRLVAFAIVWWLVFGLLTDELWTIGNVLWTLGAVAVVYGVALVIHLRGGEPFAD
jgi:hypothetical protein